MLIELDRRAVLASVDLVATITPEDLGRDTPCAGWALGDLLAHMTVQHQGFATAAGGTVTELADWTPRPRGDDPVGDYTAAARRVLDAFAREGVLSRDFTLPEITTDRTFPGRLAVGFHLVDYVVHGWDVARSLGRPYRPDAEVLRTALDVARAVPDGPARLAPGASFAPRIPVASDAPVLDQIVALLGRSPRWPDT